MAIEVGIRYHHLNHPGRSVLLKQKIGTTIMILVNEDDHGHLTIKTVFANINQVAWTCLIFGDQYRV